MLLGLFLFCYCSRALAHWCLLYLSAAVESITYLSSCHPPGKRRCVCVRLLFVRCVLMHAKSAELDGVVCDDRLQLYKRTHTHTTTRDAVTELLALWRRKVVMMVVVEGARVQRILGYNAFNLAKTISTSIAFYHAWYAHGVVLSMKRIITNEAAVANHHRNCSRCS